MFSVKSSLILLVVLLVPFVLRFRFGNYLEVYPAVLLPSGAFKVEISANTVPVNFSKIYVQQEDNVWLELDPLLFLYPIPYEYSKLIIANSFSLQETTTNNVQRKSKSRFIAELKNLNIIKEKQENLQKQVELKHWLQDKLRKLGISSHLIKIVKYKAVLSLPDEKPIRTDIIDERFIILD